MLQTAEVWSVPKRIPEEQAASRLDGVNYIIRERK